MIEISCFTFLFKFGNSSIFKYFPSTFNFEKPLFLKFKISFLYSPFLPLTIGAKRKIVLFFGSFFILSTISLIGCDLIGFPVKGEKGVPTRAHNPRI